MRAGQKVKSPRRMITAPNLTGLAEFQQQPSTRFPDAKGVELFLLRVFNVPIGIGVALLTATGEELEPGPSQKLN